MKIIKALIAILSAFTLFANEGESMKISLNFTSQKGDEKITLNLVPTQAAKSLYEMLPLTLVFSDYVAKEKISPALKTPLNTSGELGYDPKIGDFFYFSPWRNLGIFYEKQPYHSGLVFLGHLSDEDLAKIRSMKDDFEVKILKE